MILEGMIIKHKDYGYCKADLFIDQGVIRSISVKETPISTFSPEDFYVSYGFVNAHLHPNQLLDRRLLDELNITELLHQMHGTYKKTDEDRYFQALFVLMEAIKCGATSIYSVASNPSPVISAYEDLGLKGAITCFFNDQWEGFGAPPKFTPINEIEKEFSEFYARRSDRFALHIGSASVESASNELLLLLDDIAKRYSVKVNIHVSEGIEAVNSCIKSRGTTPIRLLAKLNVLAPHWNLIHAATIDDEEIDLIAKSGASVIHCPVSNAKTGVGVAPICKLIAKGVNVGLGSDACSNNNTNNILNEAYFASLIHAATEKNAGALSLNTVFNLIGVNGYKLIGMDNLGFMEENSAADFSLWSLKDAAFVPHCFHNFDSSILYNAPDVKPHSVFIHGSRIVENYRLSVFAEDKIHHEANLTAKKVFTLNKELVYAG